LAPPARARKKNDAFDPPAAPVVVAAESENRDLSAARRQAAPTFRRVYPATILPHRAM
jgi:hypothetical protein